MGAEQIVTLTGDDAALFKAYQRIIDQQIKMEKGLDRVADKAKKTKQAMKPLEDTDFAELNEAIQDLGDVEGAVTGAAASGFARMTAGITAASVAASGLMLVVQTLKDEYQDLKEIAEKQLADSRRLATSQQKASTNYGGLTQAEEMEINKKLLPEIAKRTGFSDLGLLTEGSASVISNLGTERGLAVVEQVAKITNISQDQFVPTAEAVMDIMKAGGYKSVDEALGLVLTAQGEGRVSSIPKIGTGIADVANANVMFTTGFQTGDKATQEGAALYTTLSKNDPMGASSGTAGITFASQLREFFGDSGVRQREERIQKLGERLKKTKSQDERARMLQEVKQLQDINSQTLDDPGTTDARRRRIASNPVLRSLFIENMSGEAKFRPIMEGIVTEGSPWFENFSQNLARVKPDATVFQKTLSSQTVTSDQKLAVLDSKSEAIDAASVAENDSLKTIAAAQKIEQRVLASGAPINIFRRVENALLGKETWVDFANPEGSVQSIISNVERFRNDIVVSSPETARLQESVNQQLGLLKEMLAELKATRLAAEQPKNPPPPPPPANANTINAAQQQRKGM